MSKEQVLPRSGTGTYSAIQTMPLIPGGPGNTQAAGFIDVTEWTLIMFLTDCNMYIENEDTKAIPMKIGMAFSVLTLSQVHVDAAISYILA